MVIRREDRVSTVLAQDESLIDVFIELSPAFERLRNPNLRRVMTRLVTVEQAARLAGVSADDLVGRLNSAADGSSGQPRDAVAMRDEPQWQTAEKPAALLAISPEAVVEVDVREDLRAGREPFSRIMGARRTVPSMGALCVRAIFEPVPLYAVMAKQGLAHHTERREADDWFVWFYPGASADAGAQTRAAEGEGGNAGQARSRRDDPSPGGSPAGAGVIVLDVRGLEPPEPLERTLAALESLPAGGTLVQLNVRVPRFLLPRLEERGFLYEIREQREDLVRVIIFRATDAEDPEHIEARRGINVDD